MLILRIGSMTCTSAATVKSRHTHAGWHARRNIINGRKSKALRRIARTLKLDPDTKYAPVGAIRYRGDTARTDPVTKLPQTYKGGAVPRPIALAACVRRAYQEGKALYKGAALENDKTDFEQLRLATLDPFWARLRTSIDKQPEGPVEK